MKSMTNLGYNKRRVIYVGKDLNMQHTGNNKKLVQNVHKKLLGRWSIGRPRKMLHVIFNRMFKLIGCEDRHIFLSVVDFGINRSEASGFTTKQLEPENTLRAVKRLVACDQFRKTTFTRTHIGLVN